MDAQVRNGIVKMLNDAVAAQLQTLLEQKHIYQSVTVDISPFLALGTTHTDKGPDDRAVRHLLDTAWLTLGEGQLYVAEHDGTQTPCPQLLLPHIKLFCKPCQSPDAYAPLWYRDITNELRRPLLRETPAVLPKNDFQLFILAYQCQHCLGKPEAFIIRREQWKLFLDGRSPMEEVALPAFVPKTESRLYRDALIASHGGKTLAALFYLRTFIEQFARRQTGLTEKLTGDRVMSDYNKTLPQEQRSSMPSLAEWYAKLSEALHEAREDADLFAAAKEAIDHHFDIRRVFKMPENNPQSSRP